MRWTFLGFPRSTRSMGVRLTSVPVVVVVQFFPLKSVSAAVFRIKVAARRRASLGSR